MTEEFTTTRRYLTLAFAVLTELTVSLVVTGWPAFEPVLIGDKVFYNLCNATTLLSNATNTCPEQVFQLGIMSTVSFGLQNSLSPIAGYINNYYGPRYLTLLGSALGFLGYLLLSFASPAFNTYILGWGLLAAAGACSILCTKHLANLFPEYREILIIMLFVCGQTSNGCLYLFQLLYFGSGISFETICRIFLVFPTIMFIFAFFQPMKPFVSQAHSKKESFDLDISTLSFGDLFKTPHVWLLFLWVSTMGMTTYFYITTLYDNLLWLFHANRTGDPTRMVRIPDWILIFVELLEVDHLTNIFSILFIVTPSIAVPLFGIVTFKFGTYASVYLALVFIILHYVFSCIQNFWLQIFNFVLFIVIVARSACWSLLGHFSNVCFGRHFSLILSFAIMTSGIVIFLNILWSKITTINLNGNYLPSMISMGILESLVTLIFGAFVWKSRRTVSDHTIEEELSATRLLLGEGKNYQKY